MLKILKLSFLLVSVFLIFVGNAKVANIPLAPIILCLYIILAYILRKTIVINIPRNYILLIFIYTVFSIPSILYVNYLDYNYWIILLFIQAAIIITLDNLEQYNTVDAITVFLVFLIILLPFLTNVSGQPKALFGPNVLYRIGIFFYCLILLKILDTKKMRLQLFSISFIIFGLLILYLETRGGLVIFALVTVNAICFILKKNIFHYFLVATLILLMFIDLDGLSSLSHGGLRVDIHGLSEGFRLDSFSWFISCLSFTCPIFGDGGGFYEKMGNYPHNLFSEALIYQGYISFILLIICFLYVSYFFSYKKELLVGYPIILATLLSGDNRDNTIAIILLFYYVVKMKKIH